MRPEPRRPSPAGRLALCGAGGWLLLRGALRGGPLGLLQAVLGAAALYRAATPQPGRPGQRVTTPCWTRARASVPRSRAAHSRCGSQAC